MHVRAGVPAGVPAAAWRPASWSRVGRPALRWLGRIAVTAFLVVNLVNAIRKGGDFDVYQDAARRVIASQPLYADSAVARGFVGPPAQALLVTPLAALDPPVARVIWYAINVALLVYAIATWVGLLTRLHGVSPPLGMRAAIASPVAVLSLLAVFRPLQAQFEHQNLNVVLLALAAWAADAIVRGRAVAAGVALGGAAAIKIYPLIAIGWLALRWRRRLPIAGRALLVAIVVLLAISAMPILWSGLRGFVTDVTDWIAVASSGWPTRRGNQSLVAMWGRYLLGEGPDGYPVLRRDQPIVPLVLALSGATALIVIIPLLITWWRVPGSPPALVEELACIHGLAVLLSPIAWEHYWIAFFPVLVALGLRAQHQRSRAAAAAFLIGLLCFSVLSRGTVGWDGIRVVRDYGLMTWAGVIVCATLALELVRRPLREGATWTE